MRAIRINAFGIENLQLGPYEPTGLAAHEVRLKVKAVSLNYRDLLMARGLYNPRQKLPLVPCSDAACEIVEVGSAVKRWRLGDRVSPLFAQRWQSGEPTKDKLGSTLGGPLEGTLRDEMVCAEDAVVRVPAHMTDEEAATLPCAALTAWSALVTQGHLSPGDTVLVEGTGGVSLAALQIAKLAGARVIVTSQSDEKLARAKALGAFGGINYKTTPSWGRAAKELAGDAGVDHVVDVVGGSSLTEALKCVRPGGTVSTIGVLASATSEVNLLSLLMQNVRMQGVFVGHGESFAKMNAALEAGGMRPIVDKVFPIEDARGAFEHLASGSAFGKVVVRVA